MFAEQPWRSAVFRGGLLLLFLPPFGWQIAMGYRRAVGMSASEGCAELLPPLKGHYLSYYRGGFEASLVIIAYCSPSLILFWLAGLPGMESLAELILPAICFWAAVFVFPPLAIPLLPPAYMRLFPVLSPSPQALMMCSGLLLISVLLLPAAFINVSRTGSIRSAYRIDQSIRFILQNFRLYCEAWCISIAATAVAFCLGPLCPWGLFWSYLAILSAFNQALANSRGCHVPPHIKTSRLVNDKMAAL